MSNVGHLSVVPWEYRDLAVALSEVEPVPPPETTLVALELARFSEEEVQARIQSALSQAHVEWIAHTQQQQELVEGLLARQLQVFSVERAAYFQRAEADVVHLVLGIARNILQREADLDPTLLGGLVRVALDRLGNEASVRLRVASVSLPYWQRAVLQVDAMRSLELVADPALGPTDCVLESGAASAVLSIDAQLRDIEQSFLDLMARRPESVA